MSYWRLLLDKIGVSTLIPLATFALVILPVFTWLQMDWLSELREQENGQMQRALVSATNELSQEIDHTLQASFTHFNLGGYEDEAAVQEQLTRRAREFRYNHDFGSLVESVYWIHKKGNENVQTYILESAELQPAPLPESLTYLESLTNAASHCQSPSNYRGGLIQSANAMVIPEQGKDQSCGMTVILLDQHYLQTALIPQIAKKRFENGDKGGFAMGVVNNRDNRTLIYNTHDAYSIDDYQNSDYKTTSLGFGATEHAWTLMLKHRSGSIASAVNNTYFTRLLIALAMTLVIFSGLVFPYIKLFRAKAEAKDQLEFFSGLSHDLRTPLTVITATCYSLDRPSIEGDKARHYGRVINKEAARLNDMVNQVLEFSRSQTQAQSYAMEEVDLRDLVDEVLEENEDLLISHDMELDMNLSRDVPMIKADANAIKSALTNLIGNAVKYARDGQYLGLNLVTQNNKVCLSVADQGEGIPASDLSRLFKPYYRANAARNSGIQGNGLGLSMVNRIMQHHGGQVTVDSIQGQGSTFSLEFPIDQIQIAGGLELWKRRFSL